MNLVHVVSSLAGGPARILAEVVLNGQDSVQHQVWVLGDQFVEYDLLTTLEAKGHAIFFFPRKRRLDMSLLWHMRKLVTQTDPDAVVSYDFTSNVMGAISILGTRAKWFPGIHGLETAFQWWRALIFRLLSARAKRIIVPTKVVKNKLTQYKISSAEKITVISNGIVINDSKRHGTAPGERFRLVCVANFYSEIKGQQYAVEALNLLPSEYTLTFIGDGKKLAAVKDLTRQNQLEERVEFLGGLNNSVMRESLVDYDVMVVPSLSESFGIAAIEGMAAGLPVIASDVGGLPEVVNEECGLLVPAADPAALADGVRRVCEDPVTWEKMHTGALERVRDRYSVEVMAARYYQTFGDSVDGAGHV